MLSAIEFSEITPQVILGGLGVALARVLDVSLGVLRQSSVRNGYRKSAWGIGFAEALIWVVVVSSVVRNLNSPVLAVFYALGFATGTYVGVTLEGLLARGEQVVRIFSHEGDRMAAMFRELGYRVTQFEGKGRDGPVQLLFIQLSRKKARSLAPLARECDPACFIVVDDVRSSSVGAGPGGGLVRK
ncbi:MAG: DUF2179 domain-containing protein [Planctomycetes bacterium]|nr:DUF2179 domain-containing protein [Planctomycetota bacterium]MCB9934726.1 DUF2179 domain-containing protein [Planctomycetota bacterium]MCZ7605487.1 DUF5698 domain-containing protein [Planctomycetota bacterium]